MVLRPSSALSTLSEGEISVQGDPLSSHEVERNPQDDDTFLNTEDLALNMFNVDHWRLHKYMLRLDEMGIFNTFFDNSESLVAIEDGIIFLCGAPDVPFIEQLRKMDWSRPLSGDALRDANLKLLAALPRHTHWTTFHHNLKTAQIIWYNSLRAPEYPSAPFNDPDQIHLHQFFRRPHLVTPLPANPLVSFLLVYLGLQTDSFTCGFWAVYVAFGLLLRFNPVNHAISGLDIKELVGPIYLSFIGHELGVTGSLVDELFQGFAPIVTFNHSGPDFILSYRPEDIGL
ncbi:hypothetical protein DFH09DRAFT_1330665 [Mycena vulgaris]|nr:hypothetical protein DFH09DRAFT_1330665 [Mycena vulgaris]